MPPIRRKTHRKENIKKKIAAVSTVKILDLNEDCLLDVFRYLTPFEMCAVRDTCHRFRELADRHMKTIFKSEELILSNHKKSEYSRQKKVFFKFCGALTKLTVNISVVSLNWHQENDVIYSRIRACKPKLDSLTLTDNNFEQTRRLQPFFQNLRKMKLEYCDNDFPCDIRREETIKELFKACVNVEQLSFGAKVSAMGSCYQGIFLQQKFKNLHSLELNEVRDFDLNNLKIFLKLNPNVRKLSLKGCVQLIECDNFNFVKDAPNIEGLSLKLSNSDTAGYLHIYRQLNLANFLHELEKLKYLALDTLDMNITNCLKKMAKRNSLVHLSLTNVCYKMNEGLGDVFTNWDSLKVLRLHYTYPFFVRQDLCKILCKNVINLEELYLFRCYMNIEHVKDIIGNSAKLKKLYLPELDHIYNRSIDEEFYLEMVDLRHRTKAIGPLTIYLENEFSFPNTVRIIPAIVLQIHSNAIILEKFNPEDFDDYMLPD